MKPAAKAAQVPKLRFPGFVGEWKETTLSDAITSLDAGVSVNSEDTPVSGDELGILKTSCVTKGYFDASENKRVTDSTEIRRLKEPASKDSIIISRMNTPALVGLSGLVTQDEPRLFLPDRLWAAKISANHAPRWIAQLLASEKVRGQLSERASGTSGSMKNITKGDVFSLPVITPKLPEQQKIAAFLTAVDGRVEQLSRKKALLEATKKGVMQQLFTQTLRFQDDHGHDFPDWEEKTLGEVSFNVMYGMNAAAKPYDGETKYIRITDIDDSSHRFVADPITSPDEPAEERYKLKNGDLVFTRTGASVGKSYLYDPADGNLAFAGFLIRFSIDQSQAHPYFIFLQTLIGDYWKWVKVNSMRSGQPGINAEEYKLLPLRFPSLPEQTKIARFLSALDQKIGAVGEQMRQTQAWKKGLLQQLFV